MDIQIDGQTDRQTDTFETMLAAILPAGINCVHFEFNIFYP